MNFICRLFGHNYPKEYYHMSDAGYGMLWEMVLISEPCQRCGYVDKDEE